VLPDVAKMHQTQFPLAPPQTLPQMLSAPRPLAIFKGLLVRIQKGEEKEEGRGG